MAQQNIDMMAAILESSEKYARNRPAEIEARLIEGLIKGGKARCERSPRQPMQPPVVTDLFAHTTELPEIHADQLSRDTLAAGILHHGALLVRQLYNGNQLESLRRTAASQEEADRQDNLPLGCSPYTLLELLEIYEDCGLLNTVRSYLNDEAVLFAERAKLRHHRAERDKYAAIPWHQDVNFFGRKSYGINCWAAVTPCGENNPGLSIIPRRIEDRLGWNEDDGIAPLDYGRSLPPETLQQLSSQNPIAHPVLQPGDALLFDEMTVHQTALKRWSLDEQVVTISWFFHASKFPAWGTPLAI